LFFIISVNLLNCSTDKPCAGPFGKRFVASMNSISFVTPPSLDILQVYYYGVASVFERNFPRKPPNEFNYTAENLPANLLTPSFGTEVRILECNASVEIILQGTNVLAVDNHLIHAIAFTWLDGDLGILTPVRILQDINLVDPPEETTVGVSHNGWAAIRFRADNFWRVINN